jgi:hypothetical protein
MRSADDRVTERLLADHRGGAPGGCPDENFLAAFAEGRLAEPDRIAAEAHLSRCGECRAVVAVAAPVLLRAPARARVLPVAWMAAAAVVLVAFGALLLFLPSPAAEEGTLVADARRLRDADPDLFRWLEPLDAAELTAPPDGTERGSLRVLAPRGTVLTGSPELTWEAVPGVERYEVTLLSDEGTAIWTIESSAAGLSWPEGQAALAPGSRVVVEVAAKGAVATAVGRRAFRVAGAAESAAWHVRLAAIGAAVPESRRDLLAAHFAVRLGLFGEAERLLARRSAVAPDDAEVRALARWLDLRRGG